MRQQMQHTSSYCAMRNSQRWYVLQSKCKTKNDLYCVLEHTNMTQSNMRELFVHCVLLLLLLPQQPQQAQRLLMLHSKDTL